MNGNLLLSYLSEIGHGHWARFASTLETLGATWGRSTHALQLSMLGHVEFDFCHQPKIRWAVSPPVLAGLPRDSSSPYRAVLCGWRTQTLLDVLFTQAQLFDCTIETVPQQHNPDAIFVQAVEPYQMNQFAQAVGLTHEPQVAERLAHCLPTLSDYRRLCKTRPEPQGYGIRHFDKQSARWHEVESVGGNGLYAYLMADGSSIYCYKRGSIFLEVPRALGLYFWLSDQQGHFLEYDEATQTLTAPRFANLPSLFARSAVLCSGMLPKLAKDQLSYRAVSASVAYNLMTKLNQAVSR